MQKQNDEALKTLQNVVEFEMPILTYLDLEEFVFYLNIPQKRSPEARSKGRMHIMRLVLQN
jgi:hypothetical protein